MAELKPWYAIATPHEDIQKGRLSEAVFAANLWAVAQDKEAPEVYRDADAFYAKTYLTTGLTNVLRKVASALAGGADAGDRILSLQTSFGGGKTHSLVALWHLAKSVDKMRKAAAFADVRAAIGDDLPRKIKAVAVFTNQTCDATQGRKTPEGIQTRTLWGELALQLGGVELYKKIEANDQSRTVPQGLFVEILREATPCLILIDELADYCVGAAGVEVGNTTLADQTISFTQQLTEAVGQVKGVALVATLPASHLEVASSEKGQEILDRLEKRFGRMSADVKPVGDDEVYEVVRRRLFESLGDPAEHARVAEAYMKMYQQHQNEVPTEASKRTYQDRLLAAYPFHPTLIDGLYLRWGSHGDFQRTRGVLRLLASVVGDLWKRRNNETQSAPLIQPCHVSWKIDAMHAALTRLWGAPYETVVAADVLGSKANAELLDEERGSDYVNEKIARGLAASILLGSFGGQAERAGFSTKELKLSNGRPTLNWSYTDGALLALEERAFYLHTASAGSQGKRYWFGTKPTLTKLIVQYRAQFSSQDFDNEILETLHSQVMGVRFDPATWRVLINPEADLPEQKSLVLLVMPPDYAHTENGGDSALASTIEKRVLNLSQKCGTKERHYRNTLLFLLPSGRGLTRLRNAFREVIALESVRSDYSSQLDEEQAKDLNTKINAARKAVNEALGSAYSYMARVEGQRVAMVALTDAKATFEDHLRAAWKQIVEDEEWVLRKVGPVTLQKVGLVPSEGGSRIKDASEAFLRFTDKPIIASREAVLEGLRHACREKLIGLGRGINLNSLQTKWCGEDVILDPNEEGLWILPPFEPQLKDGDSTTRPATGQPRGASSLTSGPEPAKPNTELTAAPTGKQIRRIMISGNVSLDSWSDIFRAFVNPAGRMNLKHLRLGIDFELETQDGQHLDENDPALKAMKEAARQLGLEIDTQS